MGLVHQDDIIDIINLMNNNSSVYIITYYHKVYGRYSNEHKEHTQGYIQELVDVNPVTKTQVCA